MVLIQLAQDGDREALEILLKRHEPLILCVIKKFGLLPSDENLNGGRVGLWICIKRFDLKRGTKFSTYAVHWIRAGIQKANYLLSNEKWILNNSVPLISVESKLLPLPNKRSDCQQGPMNLDQVLDKVCKNERQRKIMEMRRNGYTLKEIGQAMYLTAERIRQIIVSIVDKAKKYTDLIH
jgi:RNA polymerase sigma factor (sigma-70 family)